MIFLQLIDQAVANCSSIYDDLIDRIAYKAFIDYYWTENNHLSESSDLPHKVQ